MEPLFLPFFSSKINPIHSPLANFVSPMNAIVPTPTFFDGTVTRAPILTLDISKKNNFEKFFSDFERVELAEFEIDSEQRQNSLMKSTEVLIVIPFRSIKLIFKLPIQIVSIYNVRMASLFVWCWDWFSPEQAF